MVERVECLEAQLQSLAFGNGESLEDRHIRLIQRRSGDRVASLIAQLAGVRRQRQPLKAGRVEPICGSPRAAVVRIANQIRAIGQGRQRDVIRLDHGQWESRLRLNDAVQLPAAQYQSRRLARA